MLEPPNKNDKLRLKALIPRQAGQQGRPPKWIVPKVSAKGHGKTRDLAKQAKAALPLRHFPWRD